MIFHFLLILILRSNQNMKAVFFVVIFASWWFSKNCQYMWVLPLSFRSCDCEASDCNYLFYRFCSTVLRKTALSYCELPASKEAGFRRRQSKYTGFEPAGSLFSYLSGWHIMSRLWAWPRSSAGYSGVPPVRLSGYQKIAFYAIVVIIKNFLLTIRSN